MFDDSPFHVWSEAGVAMVARAGVAAGTDA